MKRAITGFITSILVVLFFLVWEYLYDSYYLFAKWFSIIFAFLMIGLLFAFIAYEEK